MLKKIPAFRVWVVVFFALLTIVGTWTLARSGRQNQEISVITKKTSDIKTDNEKILKPTTESAAVAPPAQATPSTPPAPAAAPAVQPQAQPKSVPPAPATGSYISYTDSALASTSGQRVLFFHASWCPQCQKVDADIKNDGVPSGVTVFKVDYDTAQSLRQKYGITLQTTFVKLDSAGNSIGKYVAYNEPTFDSVRAALGF